MTLRSRLVSVTLKVAVESVFTEYTAAWQATKAIGQRTSPAGKTTKAKNQVVLYSLNQKKIAGFSSALALEC